MSGGAFRARAVFNPNLRTPEGLTIVDLLEDVDGELAVGDLIDVIEGVSGLRGPAQVVEIDGDVAYVDVAWNRLRA